MSFEWFINCAANLGSEIEKTVVNPVVREANNFGANFEKTVIRPVAREATNFGANFERAVVNPVVGEAKKFGQNFEKVVVDHLRREAVNFGSHFQKAVVTTVQLAVPDMQPFKSFLDIPEGEGEVRRMAVGRNDGGMYEIICEKIKEVIGDVKFRVIWKDHDQDKIRCASEAELVECVNEMAWRTHREDSTSRPKGMILLTESTSSTVLLVALVSRASSVDVTSA
ncbi:hypothetical protein RvY_00845 [Ramazzottius varieornatus]|uniref:Uncharacterized protein n=1 Tax=Ramazzottius varieornatus TaxID=947166 RepID=A0A1D1UE69_RAMVA|nr:hypothetical protein RvY_00845 [Ramazzottius varieornatus]